MIQKLIDAYELEREMYRKCIDTDEEIKKGRAKWDSGLWIRYKVFEETIILAQRVDTVKHGHWVQGKESSRCSECNCTLAGQALWMYCPNCGAKMEVEDETD